MTNEDIIFSHRIELMNQGIINGTGEFFISEDGEKIEIPEEIHTFQGWKLENRQVKKGEHSIAQFPIWKYVNCKKKDDSEDRELMFMTKAFFFKKNQTEPIK